MAKEAEEDLETILEKVKQGHLTPKEAQILMSAKRKARKSYGIRNFFLTLLGIGALAGGISYYKKLTEKERTFVEYKEEYQREKSGEEQSYYREYKNSNLEELVSGNTDVIWTFQVPGKGTFEALIHVTVGFAEKYPEAVKQMIRKIYENQVNSVEFSTTSNVIWIYKKLIDEPLTFGKEINFEYSPGNMIVSEDGFLGIVTERCLGHSLQWIGGIREIKNQEGEVLSIGYGNRSELLKSLTEGKIMSISLETLRDWRARKHPEALRQQAAEEQGPKIYGVGEWARVGNVMYKVNEVTTTTLTEGEVWSAFDRLNNVSSEMGPEWHEFYSKFLVVNVTAKSLKGEQEVDFNLPLDIDGELHTMADERNGWNRLGIVLYSVLNHKKDLGDTKARVTEYTPATRSLAYEMEKWKSSGYRTERLIPRGITRLKLNNNIFIEIGNTEDW